MTYIEGTALTNTEGVALQHIPTMLEKQNELLEQQNQILLQLIETLKWLK